MLLPIAVFQGLWTLASRSPAALPLSTMHPCRPLEGQELAWDNLMWVPPLHTPSSWNTSFRASALALCGLKHLQMCCQTWMCVKFYFASAAHHTIAMMPAGEDSELSGWCGICRVALAGCGEVWCDAKAFQGRLFWKMWQLGLENL